MVGANLEKTTDEVNVLAGSSRLASLVDYLSGRSMRLSILHAGSRDKSSGLPYGSPFNPKDYKNHLKSPELTHHFFLKLS